MTVEPDAQTIPSIHFDSSTLPLEQQFPAQQRFMLSFDASTPNPAAGFFARSSAWVVDGMIVTISNLGPIGIERSEARIRGDSVDHYVVAVLIEGTVWELFVEGSEVRVDPGEICILDMTRPMRSDAGPGTTIIVLMPRQMLDEALPPQDVHGIVLDAPAGRLLTDYLTALVRRLPTLAATDAPAIARGTRDLLAATLGTARKRSAPAGSGTVLLRAKRHIAKHLAGDLSAGALSAAMGVSRSTLFRTFEHMEGLEGFVQARRLARAHELLVRSDSPSSISQIAFAVGFKSGAHFSRAFRGAYGYTARDLQAGHPDRSAAALPDTDVHRIFAHWSRLLR